MISYQLFVWVSFSIIGAFAAYILLECKSRYLLITTILFSTLLGFATCYLWIQLTGGLAMYHWALIILPAIFSSVGTVIFLSYYKAYHPRLTFPKRPKFASQKLAVSLALIGVLISSFSLVMFTLPSGDPTPAIATLGSSGTTATTADEVTQTPISTDSFDIKIQGSVVGPMTMRDNPKVGEYYDFKVEFDPSFTYYQPSLKVFVQNEYGELIPEANIISYTAADNVLEGQIYCELPGTYNITVAAYDLSASSTIPMATNTMSYTVYSIFVDDPAIDNVYIIMLVSCVTLVGLVIAIALGKKYL